MPGPERAASSSVARPMSAAVGMTPSAEAKKIATAPACASSSTIAIGMNGTSRYGQPWLVLRNRRSSTEAAETTGRQSAGPVRAGRLASSARARR